MHFTYEAYRELLELLREHGYMCASYQDWQKYQRCVILRHDIDNDIARALNFARLENALHVKSTYFVLLRSDMYNAFSSTNTKMLREILHYGHDIGLHFDEMSYPDAIGKSDKVQEYILEEAFLLGKSLNQPVKCVSMHRPSREILAANIEMQGLVNSYGRTFFHTFKYISDSRRHWREPVEDIVKNEEYDYLHILTHAFWYLEEEQDMRMTLETFINHAKEERYHILRDNITNLDEVILEDDVMGYAQRQS